MATALGLIDHIVVLMLENRSFDNMLGWQFGLDPNRFNLTDQGERITVWGNKGTDHATMTIPDPDPGELFTDMTYQLFERYFIAERRAAAAGSDDGRVRAELRESDRGHHAPVRPARDHARLLSRAGAR